MKKLFGIFLAVITMGICVAGLSSFDTKEAPERLYVKTGGSGDGLTADSPMASLAAAYKTLTNGGEIVIMGSYRVPLNRERTTRSAFVEPEHAGKITVRGYDSSSILLFNTVYEYHLGGDTEIRDIT